MSHNIPQSVKAAVARGNSNHGWRGECLTDLLFLLVKKTICSVSGVKNKKCNGDVIKLSLVKSDLMTEIPQKQRKLPPAEYNCG